MKNERGAILPVILIFSALLSMFSLYVIEQYHMERLFYHQAETEQKIEYLVSLAFTQYDEYEQMAQGTLAYYHGRITYTVTNKNEKELTVHAEIMITQEKTVKRTVVMMYDRESQKLLSWKRVYV